MTEKGASTPTSQPRTSRVKVHPSLNLGDPIDKWGFSSGLRGAEYLDDERLLKLAITRRFKESILDLGVMTGL